MKSVEPPALALPAGKVWPLSITAYHLLGDADLIPKNTELLYGVVYQKMSKSPVHSAFVRRLLKLLRNVPLPGCFASSEQPLTCKDSEPEPDIAVVRGSEDDFWGHHPYTAELVIEVCVSSHDYDRAKLRAYAGAAVKEVWFVLVPEKQIEVHRKPAGDVFAEKSTYHAGRAICGSVPGFELELEKFFEK